MSGLFRAGQLVTPIALGEDTIDLYNKPGGAASIRGTGDLRVVGSLHKGAVALVIAIERLDAGSVYVLGPTGGGWAFGAFLSVVKL